MFLRKHARWITLYALTPCHAGAGSSTGAIDLPIQREKHTNWPVIQSSGVKGAFRDLAETLWGGATNSDVQALFGKASEGAERFTQPGALSFTDARLLALPVRSNIAPFVWVGCPALLTRVARDLALSGLNGTVSTVEAPGEKALGVAAPAGTIVLEDLALSSDALRQDGNGTRIMERATGALWREIKDRWFLVSDQHFQFLTEHATEVQPRIALGPNKTTDEGLWYQEVLPPETLLYSRIFATGERRAGGMEVTAVLEKLDKLKDAGYIQMGGDETLGRGIFEMVWIAEHNREVAHAG
jgi:CRISPR-associated protein Cmr4